MCENPFGGEPRLPQNIRKLFMWVCQEVVMLQGQWKLYLGLFSKKENTELLSDIASGSFILIEKSLANDIAMSISRLSDPAESIGKSNISFSSLIKRCGNIKGMSGLFAEFDKACKPVRKYRHRRVGHNDLNSTIKPHDNPLPTVSREQIDKILNLASDILNTILNTIYKHFVIDSELHFDPFYLGGADTLLYYLRKGRESQRIGFKGTVNHESCIVFGCPRQAAYNVKNAAVLAD